MLNVCKGETNVNAQIAVVCTTLHATALALSNTYAVNAKRLKVEACLCIRSQIYCDKV